MQDGNTITLPIEAVFADAARRTLSDQALELFSHSLRQSAIQDGASFQGAPSLSRGSITQNFSFSGREYRLTLDDHMQVSYQVLDGEGWQPSPESPLRRLVIVNELYQKLMDARKSSPGE